MLSTFFTRIFPSELCVRFSRLIETHTIPPPIVDWGEKIDFSSTWVARATNGGVISAKIFQSKIIIVGKRITNIDRPVKRDRCCFGFAWNWQQSRSWFEEKKKWKSKYKIHNLQLQKKKASNSRLCKTNANNFPDSILNHDELTAAVSGARETSTKMDRTQKRLRTLCKYVIFRSKQLKRTQHCTLKSPLPLPNFDEIMSHFDIMIARRAASRVRKLSTRLCFACE